MKVTKKGKGYEARFRCGSGPRRRIVILAPSEPVALARAERIRARIDALVAAGRPDSAAVLLDDAASARTERAFADIERAMRDLALESSAPGAPRVRTFGEVLDLWLSGEARRLDPDAADAQSEARATQIRGMYAGVIKPILGGLPVRDVTWEDAMKVKSAVAGRKQSTRRRYETVVRMVLRLAIHPFGLIETSPIKPGYVESEGKVPQFGYLLPHEEAQLARYAKVDLTLRAARAFTARNGTRLGETGAATWSDYNRPFRRFELDRNKTDTPRAWTLDKDVCEALDRLREESDTREDGDLIFPGFADSYSNGAELFRDHLMAAGVTRGALHDPKGNRRRIRAYDLRATFCTVAIGSGRGTPSPERWVRRRTGHTTIAMLERYVREAETYEDVKLEWFEPMSILWSPSEAPAASPTGDGIRAETEQGVGHEVGHPLRLEPKKAVSGNPKRVPSRTLELPGVSEIPEKCAPSVARATGGRRDGPPGSGLVGQPERPITDPVARQILLASIDRAITAGEWAIVDRLTRALDGQTVAAPATVTR